MKFRTILSCAALLAMPVSAGAAHRTTINHASQAITVAYEPQVVTKLRQGGLGPRMMPFCMWEAHVAVERTAQARDGRAVSALGRSIPAVAVHKGQATGYCHEVSDSRKAGFVGGEAALHGIATAVAASDADMLRRDLASLHHLATAATR